MPSPLAIGGGRARRAGVSLDDLYRGAGDRGARGVPDHALEHRRGTRGLRGCPTRQQQERRGHDPAPRASDWRPHGLLLGIDANAAGLRKLSGRAVRERLGNVLYVRASVEDLPLELAGTADRVTVVLPWGSLLAAVAGPRVPALAGIRMLCQPEASLSVVLSVAERDRREARRLGV